MSEQLTRGIRGPRGRRGSEEENVAPPPAAPKPPRPLAAAKPAKSGWWWGTGRRKTAVARVRIRPNPAGEGKFLIQKTAKLTKTIEQYFAEQRDREDVVAPLKVSNMIGKLDIYVRVDGGGFMGQAGAIKLGLARALKGYDPTTEQALRDHSMLTRDARDVERKKYGQAGARRRFQFSKR